MSFQKTLGKERDPVKTALKFKLDCARPRKLI